MAGKGDKRRPLSVSYEKYAERYDAIFGKRSAKEQDEEESVEDETDPEAN